MKWLSGLAIAVGGLVFLVGAFAFGARFADGPVAIFPGGPFESGEWAETEDFSFAKDLQEIELQSGAEPTSRTVWVLVEDGRAYVPCSLAFPPGKRWHTEALRHPDAVVRIEGRRYRRRLQKVEDPALIGRLTAAAQQKYGAGPPGDSGIWFFLLAPPA